MPEFFAAVRMRDRKKMAPGVGAISFACSSYGLVTLRSVTVASVLWAKRMP
jgi:hypothetical protein